VKLEKPFRNDLFKAIEAAGLDPGEFDLDLGDTDESEARISHRWSESYFVLGGNFSHFVGSYVVGDSAPWPYDAYIWPNVEERVKDWAAKVKRDLETPDMWAELRQRRRILTRGPDEGENAPFTPDEQAEIMRVLDEIKKQVKETHPLTQAQIAALEAGVDELKGAVRILGRRHFQIAVLGVVATLLLGGVLPPDVVSHFMGLALHGLQHLVFDSGGSGPPPELPPPPPTVV
jgi:hypothetical protein